MRKIHLAMWAGFLINIAIVAIVIMFSPKLSGLLTEAGVSFSPEEFESMLHQTRLVQTSAIVFQAFGIAAFFWNPRIGLLVAMCASLMQLPFSIIYIVGALLTFYQTRFGVFPWAPEMDDTVTQSFANWRGLSMLKYGLLTFAMAFLALFAGFPTLWLLGVTITIVCGILSFRARRMPPLLIFKGGIAVLPHIFAVPVFLPYDKIRSATLLAEGSVQFQVVTDEGMHVVDLPLNSIAPDQRKTAVADVADAMKLHNIQLY